MEQDEHWNEKRKVENVPPMNCKAHGMLAMRVNIILSLLVANFGLAWFVFYTEIKPIFVQTTSHEVAIVQINRRMDAQTQNLMNDNNLVNQRMDILVGRVDRHVEKTNGIN